MAYSTPRQWAHGDTVTATEMNKYRDGLNEIYSVWAGKLLIPAVPVLWLGILGAPDASKYKYELVHKQRYLLYVGEGKLYSADETQTTTLANSAGGTGTNTYDLESVSWLSYGQRYIVKGVTVCMEVMS